MIETFNADSRPFQHLQSLRSLGVHPEKHRRIVRDVAWARAQMGLFFPSVFFTLERTKEAKVSLIVDQKRRADGLPPRIRSHNSCKDRPDNFVEEYLNI